MARDTSTDVLATYLPRRLVERLARVAQRPAVDEPDVFPAATFLADLTGFTALAADLATEGPQGAERLTTILDRCLGGVAELVLETGGDVVNFAGDAVIAFWPAANEAELQTVTRRAVACAKRVHAELGGWRAHPGHDLRFRIGVGAGECRLLCLGDGEARWGWVAAGPAITAAGHAEHLARPGETVLAKRAVEVLGRVVAGAAKAAGAVVLDPHDDAALDPVRAPQPILVDAHTEGALRDYLPDAVLDRLDSGQADWLAELRQVTAVFVNLPDLDPADGAQAEFVQRIVGDIRRVVRVQGGALHKLLVDDKGMTAVIAFGLPPRSHEDDEVRAVRGAMAIAGLLARAHVEFGIGVSTGRVFAGAYGSDRRREYTILGDSVNLAARLMQLARGEVLCDADTARATISQVRFEDLETRPIKGRDGEEWVHRAVRALDSTARHEVLLTGRSAVMTSGTQRVLTAPSGVVASAEVSSSAPAAVPPRATRQVVGRDAQQQILSERLDALRQGDRGLVLVEGAPGMGKSLLLATLQRRALRDLVPFLLGSANPVRALDPYYAWREVFAPLIAQHTDDEGVDLDHWFPRGSRLAAWSPLLGPALGIGVADTELSRSMDGPQRADATRDLLLTILTRAAQEWPLLVVLDDCQWLDAASWELVLSAAQTVPSLLLVLSHRPLDDPPSAFAALVALDGARRLRLDALPDRSIAELAAQLMDVDRVATEVSRLVVSRAAGNPFFCEELVHTLVESGVLRTDGGTARFAEGHDASSVDLPGTLQAVVTSRLDRLPADEQMTIKVASVLGGSFSVDQLRAIHPTPWPRDALVRQLEHLAELDLCPVDEVADVVLHGFKHRVVQEVCAALLVPSKRRQLHAAVAAYYESRVDQSGRDAAQLAHHWRNAGLPLRALVHLERAGFAALNSGSDRDALGTLEAALETMGEMSADQLGEAGPVRRSRLLRAIGTAEHGLGRHDHADRSLRAAMQALDRAFPHTTIGWVFRLCVEGARQLAYRVLPRFLRWRAKAVHRERLRAASEAAGWYANISYFRVEPLPWLTAGLMSANLAEDAGAPEIAGAAYVNLANISGTLHLRRIERMYMRYAALSNEPRVAAIGHSSRAVVHVVHAAWAEATTESELAITRAGAAGDWGALGNALTIKALVEYFTQPVAECLVTFEATTQLMQARKCAAQVGYGLVFSVPALLALGQVDGARAQLDEGSAQLEAFDYFGQLAWSASAAAVAWRRGEREDAVEHALRALAMFKAKPLMLFTYCGPFWSVAEVLLRAVEGGESIGAQSLDDLRAHAGVAVGNLGKATRLFRYFRPRARLAKGTRAWLAGRPRRARAAWAKGLAEAQKYGMPWDQGRIHIEMARFSAPGSPERSAHEAAARALLEPMGATGTLSAERR